MKQKKPTLSKEENGPSMVKSFNAKTLTVFLIIGVIGYFVGLSATESRHDHDEKNGRISEGVNGQVVKAPDFLLPDKEGKIVTLENFRGKWLFINFWATWCAPCVEELPSLISMGEILGNKISVLTINLDELPQKQIVEWLTRHDLDNLETLFDRDGIASKKYAIGGLPMSYLINPDGEIDSKASGARHWDDPEVIDYLKGKINRAI